MEKSSSRVPYFIMRNQKFDFLEKYLLIYLSLSAVTFCKLYLAHTVHIDWCYQSIHKH